MENSTESKIRQRDLKFTMTIIASHILISDFRSFSAFRAKNNLSNKSDNTIQAFIPHSYVSTISREAKSQLPNVYATLLNNIRFS